MGFADATRLPPATEQDKPRGKMYQIACHAWFTATGAPQPLSFKFQGDDGEIQRVADIKIQYSEDKYYSGLPSKEYACEAVIGGLIREFRLIFYQDTCTWVMMIQYIMIRAIEWRL